MAQAYEDARAGQLANAMEVLRSAQAKLRLYRAHHSGSYVGGVEFHELMRRIDAVLAGKEP